jgi:ADP-heptose:LPS heptosyltransferase
VSGPRVLFVKLGALGDVSFALPAPAAIRAALPGARVSWLVGRAFADLLRGHPAIDELIEVDEKKLVSGNPLALASLAWSLRGRFDLAIIAHRARAYCYFVRPFVKGKIFHLARGTGGGALGARPVVVPPLSLHESLAIRKLVEAAVGKSVPWEWDYSYIPGQGDPASLVVHLGGGSNFKTEFRLKQWPHWKELLSGLDLRLVLVGAPSEAEFAGALARELGSRVVNRVGQTGLRELVATIRGARGFVGIDSGPLHLADSLGVPSVGLYGPTSVVSWGLLGKKSRALSSGPECSPCYRDDGVFPECQFGQRCMNELQAGKVIGALRELSLC